LRLFGAAAEIYQTIFIALFRFCSFAWCYANVETASKSTRSHSSLNPQQATAVAVAIL
jgi:hypothetical protein